MKAFTLSFLVCGLTFYPAQKYIFTAKKILETTNGKVVQNSKPAPIQITVDVEKKYILEGSVRYTISSFNKNFSDVYNSTYYVIYVNKNDELYKVELVTKSKGGFFRIDKSGKIANYRQYKTDLTYFESALLGWEE